MLLPLLDDGQKMFVYVCAGRMCGLSLPTDYPWPEKVGGKVGGKNRPEPPAISQSRPEGGEGFSPENILGSLKAEAQLGALYGNPNTVYRNLFFVGPEGFDSFPVSLTRFLMTGIEGDSASEGERQVQIKGAQKLLEADTLATRSAMFELVDVALTITLARRGRLSSDDLPAKALDALSDERKKKGHIDFVLGFAEEALLPSSSKLADFVSASAALIATSLQVADFVDTGEAPWRSEEGEGGGTVGGAQDHAEDETAEDGNGGQGDTAPVVENS